MIWRSLMRAGGMRALKKIGKAMPVVGTAVAIGLVGYEVKKKGLVRGIVNSALDATPVVGTAKNAIELVTGDWLPDKDQLKQTPSTQHAATAAAQERRTQFSAEDERRG